MSNLAKIPVTGEEEENFAKGFSQTLEVVDKLFKVGVEGVTATHQVTGLENVFREDKVEKDKMLTQEQSLSNTKSKHEGYFVVDQILADD